MTTHRIVLCKTVQKIVLYKTAQRVVLYTTTVLYETTVLCKTAIFPKDRDTSEKFGPPVHHKVSEVLKCLS